MQNDTDKLFLKIIIVGDPGVGKTSILNQYCYKRFDDKARPTIGCDFSTVLLSNYNSKVIKAQLWDVAGQEKFHALSKLYIRGAQGCIIVCDITDEKSMASSLKWKDLILMDKTLVEEQIPIVLVQNKKDLIDFNQQTLPNFVNKSFVDNFGKENGFFSTFQTSAKTSENLEEMFQQLVEEILKRIDEKRIRRNSIIQAKKMYLKEKSKNKNSGGCC